jgi:hypothetical protein
MFQLRYSVLCAVGNSSALLIIGQTCQFVCIRG